MIQYHNLLKDILENGVDSSDRTGTGTKSVFGRMIRFDLNEGFPAVTTKRLAWKAVVGELLWFLEGSTDERRLAELTFGKDREALIGKRTIWTDNADAQGVALGYMNNDMVKELGPVYGSQWRNWRTFTRGKPWFDAPEEWIEFSTDQIVDVINGIKKDPYGRRHLVTAWNPSEVPKMALPPCHFGFQFYVRDDKLSCMWNQRSVDAFLGLPFNIASYALLTHMIARECGLGVGELIGSLGDTHIYNNHISQVEEQLTREPYELPKLVMDSNFHLMSRLCTGFYFGDSGLFTLKDYQHHPALSAPMAI